jgi:glycosyltransferase involved in cell wall biosynthesis
MKPLVSILIPAYNAQEFLAASIESVLAQNWPNKELIIVDDGSKDRTLAVAHQFESATVKVLTQQNQGAAATRNRALSLAQGEFIQWLDADDLLSPEKISSQMAAAERFGRRTLYSSPWAYFMYRPQKARFTPTALWEDMSPVEWMTRKMEQNLHMQTATWLVSRDLTDAAGPWNTRLLGDDDGEYFARVLMVAKAVKFVPQGKVYYRVAPSSRLSYLGTNPRKKEAQLASMELNIAYLRSIEDTPRVRAACTTYLRNWLIHFYPERPDLVDRARQLAQSVGGELEVPHLSWKYAWIQKTLGWSAAKRSQIYYNELKTSAQRSWDRTLFRVSGSTYGSALSSKVRH